MGCAHRKACEELFHVKSCDGSGWYDCPVYDKIEDLIMEARDMARDHPPGDEIPFGDMDYDGPEVED